MGGSGLSVCVLGGSERGEGLGRLCLGRVTT